VLTRLGPEPRVGVITQARTTSTRLPRKVLLEIGGRTVLDHHLDRLTASGLEVLVATTTNSTDDEIAALARRRGVFCHRGSETDVLARFHECAAARGLDVVVRVTSDCPLVDGVIVAQAVADFLREDDARLYLSNTLERTFPRGLDFEVFSATALTEAHESATAPGDREHVTPYLYGSGRLRLQNVAWPEDKSHYRITLDTPQDLSMIRALVEEHHAADLSCAEIIDVLDRHPSLAEVNASVPQKGIDG
jgi:spore coat polysaccharide biosynthesis protein SpsF